LHKRYRKQQKSLTGEKAATSEEASTRDATHLSPGNEAILLWNTHTFYEEIKQLYVFKQNLNYLFDFSPKGSSLKVN
jgi:hypothetical protein